jgi:hypothetical protein
MLSVPSHDCSLFKKAVRNTCLLIESRSPIKLFQSAHAVFQTDPVPILVYLLTQRLAIFNCHAIHLLARCNRSDDPSARTTGRYL